MLNTLLLGLSVTLSHREIRAALADMLRGIPDIGRVHEYERWSSRAETLKAFYAHNQHLRGWYLRRVSPSGDSTVHGCSERADSWEIRGFMSVSDEDSSELLFDDLIDQVLTLFSHATPPISGLRFVRGQQQMPARLLQSQPVMFAGVLCHSAALSINTRIFINV